MLFFFATAGEQAGGCSLGVAWAQASARLEFLKCEVSRRIFSFSENKLYES
jgi:hypothetical protein